MKKIYSFALMFLSGLMALTSCSDDRDSNPTIDPGKLASAEFTINAPAFGNQYIELTKSNKVNLTWTQPDFGFNALATYKIQVGKVNADGSVKWEKEDLTDPNSADKFLETTYQDCNANISGEDIALSLNHLDGINIPEDWPSTGQDYQEIALRVYATLNTSVNTEVPGMGIMSKNFVTFKHVKAYCAVQGPGSIYVIGNCGGWTGPDESNEAALANWRLTETEIGSNIFEGTKTMPAGDLQFRFYSKLTGWDGGDSWGPQVDDAGVNVAFEDGVFEGSFDKGKGTWLFAGFEGGDVKMHVDMNQKIVKFEVVSE